MTKQALSSSDRLSVSAMKRRPRRDFSSEEVRVLRLAADTLIPAVGGHLSGSAVQDFDALVTSASTILDSKFDRLAVVLSELSLVEPGEMWEALRALNDTRQDDFYVLSLVLVAAYLYSAEMKQALQYPAPHQNPANMFDVAEELSSGILDPVTERGPIFVPAD